MIRLILFSQDPNLQRLIAPALGTDFNVIAERDTERLKALLQDGSFDVVIFDFDTSCPEADHHFRFCGELFREGVAVVIMTDDGGRVKALELVQRGAHSYCRRPPSLRELKIIVQRAYEHVAMKRKLAPPKQMLKGLDENDQPPSGYYGLIGTSSRMLAVYDLIRRVADLNASVLIAGESGTGKELIARAIHNSGSRSGRPFIAVSCGAIPETLIESELFGHERGAFTGSTATRAGFFEQAAEGTLFLDEIGELSLQTQVKLLRVLQQREFTRLGSARPIPLKARILFATHRDLSRMVAEGTFRLDLYYRINVVAITAPALAEHSEDILPLAQYFIRQYSALYEKEVTGASPEANELLSQYEWPGNVRELENAIQSAIIRTDTDTIRAWDLPDRLREQDTSFETEALQPGSFERLVHDYKLKIVFKALDECNGNKSLAAASLNISRAYIHRLIRQSETENFHAA